MLDDFSDCTMARTRNMDMSTCMFHPTDMYHTVDGRQELFFWELHFIIWAT